jgi:hypothetical protein
MAPEAVDLFGSSARPSTFVLMDLDMPDNGRHPPRRSGCA